MCQSILLSKDQELTQVSHLLHDIDVIELGQHLHILEVDEQSPELLLRVVLQHLRLLLKVYLTMLVAIEIWMLTLNHLNYF